MSLLDKFDKAEKRLYSYLSGNNKQKREQVTDKIRTPCSRIIESVVNSYNDLAYSLAKNYVGFSRQLKQEFFPQQKQYIDNPEDFDLVEFTKTMLKLPYAALCLYLSRKEIEKGLSRLS